MQLTASQRSPGASVFTSQLSDPRAVYLAGAVGDGKVDDTDAIQRAIDQAYADRKAGIVFIPYGRYRLTRTLFVPPAVRIFGWGMQRPVFVLSDNTSGFGEGLAVMVMFVGALPSTGPTTMGLSFTPPGIVPAHESVPDANPGTFFSALSNINFVIGEGNGGAVAVRFHGAQHNFLSHIDFHIGLGLAAIHQVANEAENLRIFGGRYGILAEKPSPAWPFTLLDSLFEGQREAAIREHEASLTLDNVVFRNMPVAIKIDPDYGDWLWAKNTRFENISQAAVIISTENNVYNQIAFEDAVASNVPVFARFQESGKTLGCQGHYLVKAFNHGITIDHPGNLGQIKTNFETQALAAPPALPAPVIRALPPTESWVDIRSLGAIGDGVTDDTEAFRIAVAEHRVIYIPSGNYLLSDTLMLSANTIIIGLHPSLTQLTLPEETVSYQGVGAPKALLATPPGGRNIVTGIGLAAGGINPRAVACLWQAGTNSLLSDVYFAGGHGSVNPDGTPWNPYNDNLTGDVDPRKRWHGQYPSLWVTNGGGGTFFNIWTPAAYAQAGILISDTTTAGRIYQLSSEHHVRNEVVLRNVENWQIYALQTEEEAAEGREAVGLEIHNCRHITIANYHAYRVTRSRGPAVAAIQLFNSSDIRFRNIHVNAESGFAANDKNGLGTFLRASKFSFDNSIHDPNNKIQVREREFALLDYLPKGKMQGEPAGELLGHTVKKLAENFYSISGAAIDASGRLYFVDKYQQRIYSWSEEAGLNVERDCPLDPVNLAFDQSGNLIVLSSAGEDAAVYAYKPASSAMEMTLISATAVDKESLSIKNRAILLPGNYWNNGEFKDQLDIVNFEYVTLAEMFMRDLGTPKSHEYVSPDGSLVLPAARVFHQGPSDYRGWCFSDSLDTFGFIKAKPGERVFVINSSEARTYHGRLNANGTVTDLQCFANRGGESVAVHHGGNVYIANGQIWVFEPSGKCLGQINVPERPLQLIFGGANNSILYVLTHRALYSVLVSSEVDEHLGV